MKANKVSALRSKRGLHRVNGAEPQVVGLTPQTTDLRKTDTMKTYILRSTNTVEPQKLARAARPQAAVATSRTHQQAGPLRRAGRSHRLHRRESRALGFHRGPALRDHWRHA